MVGSDNDMQFPDVGKRLVKIRTLAGFGGRKQAKFAESIGTDKNTYNRWERGAPPPVQKALLLIEAVKGRLPGLTLDYIYRGDRRGLSFALLEVLGPEDD